MLNPFQDPIDSFLNSLTYWQLINLRTRLILGKYPEKNFSDAKRQAVVEFYDEDKLKYDLEEALNSPK